MLREFDELYIPTNERSLRRVQRKGEELDKHVRTWAQHVSEVLPRGLPLNPEERLVVCLFLSQQRRLNLQMDAFEPDTSFVGTARQIFPFFNGRADPDAVVAVHRIVALRLDSDIERTSRSVCEDNNVDPNCDAAIDWRVGMRFMAQSIYSRVGNDEPKKLLQGAGRFELALVARDLAAAIVEKRDVMLATSSAKLDPTLPRRRSSDVA